MHLLASFVEKLKRMTCIRLTRMLVFSSLLLSAEVRAFAQGGQRGGSGQGAQLYATNCAGCHGADGTGSSKGIAIATLATVVALSDDALISIVHKGALNAGMPPFPQLSDPETQAVVRYLRTLQGVTATPVTAAKPTGNADAGKTVYFGKGQCLACHMISGEGGPIASDLTAYGQKRAPSAVLQAIVKPDTQLAPGSRAVEVRTRSGESLTGVVRSEDNLRIQLQTEDGRFHFLLRSELAEVHYTDHSLMPRDYGTRLTAKELDDLVSFLIATGKDAPVEAAPTGRGRRGGGN
jgi:cytochrome c oxidase cbb3-type subunit 3